MRRQRPPGFQDSSLALALLPATKIFNSRLFTDYHLSTGIRTVFYLRSSSQAAAFSPCSTLSIVELGVVQLNHRYPALVRTHIFFSCVSISLFPLRSLPPNSAIEVRFRISSLDCAYLDPAAIAILIGARLSSPARPASDPPPYSILLHPPWPPPHPRPHTRCCYFI